VATARELEAEVWALAAPRGVRIEKQDGVLLVDDQRVFSGNAEARKAAIVLPARQEYQEMRAALRCAESRVGPGQ